MRNPGPRLVMVALLAIALGGCALDETPVFSREPVNPKELKVGITPTYPPIIFRLGGPTTGAIAGVEADLARRLGEAIGLPIRYVVLPWDDQIPALLAGKTDIIMSGMSVTQARQVRIAFTDPYLESGLAVAMRTEDAARFNSRERVVNSDAAVGVVERTTGDVFAQQNMPSARRVLLARASDGALELKRRTIDLFLHDAPSIAWLVSENEATLTGFFEPLSREALAWGVRRNDTELLNRADSLIRRWKGDGSLDALLDKWLPYRRRRTGS